MTSRQDGLEPPRPSERGQWPPPASPAIPLGVFVPRKLVAGAPRLRNADGLAPVAGGGESRRGAAALPHAPAARPRLSLAPLGSARRAASPGWRPSPRFLAAPPFFSLSYL